MVPMKSIKSLAVSLSLIQTLKCCLLDYFPSHLDLLLFPCPAVIVIKLRGGSVRTDISSTQDSRELFENANYDVRSISGTSSLINSPKCVPGIPGPTKCFDN